MKEPIELTIQLLEPKIAPGVVGIVGATGLSDGSSHFTPGAEVDLTNTTNSSSIETYAVGGDATFINNGSADNVTSYAVGGNVTVVNNGYIGQVDSNALASQFNLTNEGYIPSVETNDLASTTNVQNNALIGDLTINSVNSTANIANTSYISTINLNSLFSNYFNDPAVQSFFGNGGAIGDQVVETISKAFGASQFNIFNTGTVETLNANLAGGSTLGIVNMP